MEKIKVLKITDMYYSRFHECYMSAQFDVFKGREMDHWFDDNGGTPDGDLWIVTNINEEDDDVQAALELGAEIIEGYLVEGVNWDGDFALWFDKYKNGTWAGTSCYDIAFFTDRKDAETFIRCSKVYSQSNYCFENSSFTILNTHKFTFDIEDIDNCGNKIRVSENEDKNAFNIKILNKDDEVLVKYAITEQIEHFLADINLQISPQ